MERPGLSGLFRAMRSKNCSFRQTAHAWEEVEKGWRRELDHWGGESAIREHWRRVNQLPIDYVLCDPVEDPEPLLRRIDDRPQSAIWWSDLFSNTHVHWLRTIEQRRDVDERFVRGLVERCPGVLLQGRDYNQHRGQGDRRGPIRRRLFSQR